MFFFSQRGEKDQTSHPDTLTSILFDLADGLQDNITCSLFSPQNILLVFASYPPDVNIKVKTCLMH